MVTNTARIIGRTSRFVRDLDTAEAFYSHDFGCSVYYERASDLRS